MSGFWTTLPKPFLALAPMEDVTDSVFRQVIASTGKPDVMFTEFVNVDGIAELTVRNAKMHARLPGRCRRPAARAFFSIPARSTREELKENGLLQRLYFTEAERPLAAQIWGSKPENFLKAGKVIKELGFDGIDVNMGCPQRKVMKTGGCAALIGEFSLVKEIILAVKEGAGGLPVSVKTRIGKKEIITEEWIGFLLEQNLAAITVHGRTAAEQSKVPAHWDEIGKAVQLRNSIYGDSSSKKFLFGSTPPAVPSKNFIGTSASPLIIGNGDVKDYQEAIDKAEQYGVDGVMIGRGIFSNPRCFNFQFSVLNFQERINLFIKHINLYRETWGEKKSFYILRKFVKMYINGWEGAVKMREQLMKAENYTELLEILQISANMKL